MMLIEKFHNMKTTFIDVKVDIPFLEIRRYGFPNSCIWVLCFYGFPSSKPQTMTVIFR